MKAAIVTRLDGPEAIEIRDLPVPEPGPGEVIVRVEACALNFLDTLITRGRYQVKPELPFSPSAEMAGRIEALGAGVRGLSAGQRVCGYLGHGAARELVAVAAAQVVPIPDAVDAETAAGLNVTYGTALYGLNDRAEVKAGETVAVLGASGGAGLAAVEVAKLMGAKVIAAASSREKLETARAAGADELINYAEGDLKDALRKASGGNGVDVVYDCVGGPYAEPAVRALAWGGRFLVIGFAAGNIPAIPLNLLLLKSCDLRGVFWGAWVKRDPSKHRANMGRLLDAIAAGKIKPHVGEVLPLERIGEGVRLLDQRKATGKVVIRL